jgi:curved DNA-binding protein CbpA
MTDSQVALKEILSAKTHYGVLGVEEFESDVAVLRKAYLRRSVKVHPDKCREDTEHATAAFQKVAQAWQILGDDTKRTAYNDALRMKGAAAADMQQDYDNNVSDDETDAYGQKRHRYAQRDETFYSGPPPSMQEALFMFATVVGSMMGGKTAANITETMFWAEKLLNRTDANGNTTRGLSLDTLETMSTKDKATLAMAVGSGLKVASSAARSLGMRQSAATLEKSAQMAQMAGVAGMVADQPAVRKVLQQGSEGWKKLKSGLNTVKTVLQREEE